MKVKTARQQLSVVYLLQHVAREGTEDEDVKLLGIYSSKSRGEAAIERATRLPGFRRYTNGFYLDRIRLNEDKWTEGFVTRRWTPKPAGRAARTKRRR